MKLYNSCRANEVIVANRVAVLLVKEVENYTRH